MKQTLNLVFWTARVPDEVGDRVKPNLNRWADRLPVEAVKLATLIVDGTGVFSDAFARLVEFTDGRKDDCAIEIHKTGSRLLVYGSWENKRVVWTFANDVSTDAARAWVAARDAGIPVAPVLRPPTRRRDGSTRVFSRYCGQTSGFYLENTDVPKQFRDWLFAETRHIWNELLQTGIRHGHSHQGNFTVEFYRSAYYDRERGLGKSVNEIAFAPGEVTFDPLPYFERPSDWVPVVRLIDWDQGVSPTR